MRSAPRDWGFSLVVLAAAALVAYLWGLEASAWLLVAVWSGVFALVALIVGVLASLSGPPATRIRIRLGPGGRLNRWLLALWGGLTAFAFAFLATGGHPLFWLPFLSLGVVVLPGSGELLLDEYVQGLLAQGAALAGGLALAALPLLGLTGSPGLDVALAALAVYALALEAYVAYRLAR